MVAFSLFVFCSLSLLLLQPSPSSSSSSTTQSLTSFDPNIDLFGDAQVVSSFASDNDPDGSHVRLTRHSPFTAGLLLRRDPITFSGDPTSLSVEFSFSISPTPATASSSSSSPAISPPCSLVTASFGLSPPTSNYLGVEFDTSKDDNVNDPNANHVGIDVGSLISVAVANVSASNLVLNSGEKFQAWVDYVAGSKTLEVRLSKFGEPKSSNPIVSHPIDLFQIWGAQPVFVGMSSSNYADSVQIVSVYSWRLSLRKVSKSLDSQPVDPKGVVDVNNNNNRRFRPLTLLARVIFGTVCVALVTFVVLFMWVIFFQRQEEESLVKVPDHPVSDVRYERIDVAVDKNNEEDEN